MGDPFRLDENSVVMYSGGRTSAFMLRRILDSFGGNLPKGVVVAFANTGKERPETLDFVHECEVRWNVPIVWLEHRFTPDLSHGWRRVSYATANRDGRVFSELIDSRKTLPNVTSRYCTAELKIRTVRRYLVSRGWKHWYNVIGLRADEPKRVARISAYRERGEPLVPLYSAGITERDVLDYWSKSPFDLKLQSHEGNCDLCFLKSADKLDRLIKADPKMADWWIEQEKKKAHAGTGGLFRLNRPTYSKLKRGVSLPVVDEDDLPCTCTD